MATFKKQIYLDYAATTPVDPRVMRAMAPYFSGEFGNASSLHTVGQESARAVDRARESIADFLNCKSNEVIFTSGATEANNLAIKGVAEALKKYGDPSALSTLSINSELASSSRGGPGLGHIITSQIEHPCVLESCKYLEKQGFKVIYLPVYKNGVVKVEDVKKAITDKTILISIMYVNNEIGTIQPIAEIGRLITRYKIQDIPLRGITRRVTRIQSVSWRTKIQSSNSKQISKSNPPAGGQIPVFHCDATQAVNYLDCSVDKLGVDLLSLSAHKIYGPKGVGALYIRKGTPIEPLLHGGHQESGLRAGTLNHVGIVGFGKAIGIIHKNIKTLKYENKRIRDMRDWLIREILKIPGARLNGGRKLRVANNVNISFERVEGEALLMMLDFEGIAVSTGSACASGSLEPSHVLMALGMNPVLAHGSIRITLGRFTKESEIKKLLVVLPEAITKLRKISMQ